MICSSGFSTDECLVKALLDVQSPCHWGLDSKPLRYSISGDVAGIQRVAVSVYGGDIDYRNRAVPIIRDALGDVHVEFFDSQSVGCWNN